MCSNHKERNMSGLREGDIVRDRNTEEIFKIEKWSDVTGIGLLLPLSKGGRYADRRKRSQVVPLREQNYQILCHPAEEYQAYLRGFKDGTIMTAKRERHVNNDKAWIRVSYLQGYEDGKISRGKAMKKWCEKIGFHPQILR